MSKSSKGSGFEREICKQLSLWWTCNERDDVFWRTAGSGARATVRKKTNQSTFGQYGDVQATDPIGQNLLDVCTIELKRGYSNHHFSELIDRLDKAAAQTYEKFIQQAIDDAKKASTPYWMLIVKRDRRKPLLFIPYILNRKLNLAGKGLLQLTPSFLFSCQFSDNTRQKIVGCTLQGYLEKVEPGYIEKLANDKPKNRNHD